MPHSHEFLLLGDSHAAAIGHAAKALGLKFYGGPIGSGREFFAPFFQMENSRIQFTGEQPRTLLDRFLKSLETHSLEDLRIPLLSTLGLSPHFPATYEMWSLYEDEDGGHSTDFLESHMFGAIVDQMIEQPMHFYRHLIQNGVDIVGIVAPQRVPELSSPAVFKAVQDRILLNYKRLGVTLLDARHQSCGDNGWLLQSYCKDGDPLHANQAFGELVIAQWLAYCDSQAGSHSNRSSHSHNLH